MVTGPGEVSQTLEDERVVVGPLGIWGMAMVSTEATAWSCGQEGCLVKSRHEHEQSVDTRLRELRQVNAEFERRHPSLRGE